MKKWLLSSAAAAILLLAVVPVGAAPSDSQLDQPAQQEAKKPNHGWLEKAEFMEKYRDEWRQLNMLQKENLELRIEMLNQREQLADLMMNLRKEGDLGKLKPAAEMHQMMKSLHKQKKALQQEYDQQRKEMAEAMKKEDDKKMKAAMQKMIEIKQKKNDLNKQSINATNKFMERLSK